MAQQQRGSRPQTAEQERREQDEERSRDWGDEAAKARVADDPRAMAPRDAAGRPSQGRSL
ncbi:hypothetical protein Q3W71_07310 [Micromonospora sp. C28SCA-DRY-2]|uniref:hypothetical protein n=1 Tax=Micromonospora sp. C28SCA-DRY-2 TaxID=3059522 RepID=UPI002674F153|nr:hypothetical protein [Micromonospora sp. C28SCA-DRY-2]MDO3701488.1 hypothetical protein [Micromonospora sp. C28SCA-DRY-2]